MAAPAASTPPPAGPTACEAFLAQLRGRWEGTGNGTFPTMPDFTYAARFDVTRVAAKTPKGYFLHTATSSWRPQAVPRDFTGGDAVASGAVSVATDEPLGMHFDNGFIKCGAGPNKILYALAHNFAGTEDLKGTVSDDGTRASFLAAENAEQKLGNMTEVVATQRELVLEDGGAVLRDRFYMATQTVPEMTLHLDARMVRV